MCVAAGQLLFASEKLREEKGVNNHARQSLRSNQLLVPVEMIAAAFWETKWGKAMKHELDNEPFQPCALLPLISCIFGVYSSE